MRKECALATSEDVIILGASGNAHDVLDAIEARNANGERWRVIGILDDVRPIGDDFFGHSILGALRDAAKFSEALFLNAIGSDKTFRQRPALVEATGLPTECFATVLHPNSSISGSAALGRGVTVSAGVVIGSGCVIGDHVTICAGAIIGHDAILGEHCVLAPASVISGGVRVGANCYIGANAVVRQQLRIGARALIGMGATVIRDVPPEAVMIGNPARPLRKRPV